MQRRDFILSSLAAAGSMTKPLAAQADTLDGESIEWIVPFRDGGGADIWARFMAPFLSQHLPGQPPVEVTNVPGGGSTKAANRYSSIAGTDGRILFSTSASTQFSYLLEDPRVRYSYDQWQALMVYPTGGVVYLRPELGITDAAELASIKDSRLVYGSQGTTSLDLVLLLGFELLGLDVKPIFGLRGRSAGRIAFEKGQATIDFQTSSAYIKNVTPLVEAGNAVPLFSLGVLDDNGQLARDPTFPELPHFGEVYRQIHGRQPYGVAWESWFAFYLAGFGAQKLLVLPKAANSDVVAMYKEALQAALSDPNYLAKKNSVIGSYRQGIGESAEKLYQMATHIPVDAKRWIRKWLRDQYKVNI